MTKNIILIIVLVFAISIVNHKSSFLQSQVVYVPVENGVYEFLERMNLKGFIKLDDEDKPFSRMYTANKLIEIEDELKFRIKSEFKSGENKLLNRVEIDELEFYMEEYFYEISTLIQQSSPDTSHFDYAPHSGRQDDTSSLDSARDDTELHIVAGRMTDGISQNLQINNYPTPLGGQELRERWFLYSYSDSLFNFKLSPIAGYGLSSSGNNSGHTRWIGLSTFGTYSDWFGFSFDIRDKGEFGSNADKNKYFSPIRGAWYKGAPDGIEYSDAKGSINFNWSWGQVSLIKDYIQWGHGKFGQLILSDKSPSYPQIRLQIKPVEWLRFSYMHGWLSSLVYDSVYFYNSYPGTMSETLVESYIPKYIAANMLTVAPFNWLDVSLGNSVVYGGELRPEFFIPFMFYKFLDHNSGRGGVNDANGVMYFDISAKYPKNFKFYGTMFIDVTEIRNILENDFENTWIGFTLGAKSVDVFLDNFDVTAEYTRLNPWVYEHKNEVTNFKHLKYSLGHWVGQNGDQFRVQFNYQLLRGLKFQLYTEFIRKGGLDEIYYAYGGTDEKDHPFLYTPVREESRIGFDVSYEYMHDLILKGSYAYSDITDEDLQREPVFMIGTKNSFSITLFYGL